MHKKYYFCFRKFLTCQFYLADFNEMREFVRPFQKHVKDLFILDIDALRDFSDDFMYHTPYSLSESQFHAPLGGILEESSYSLIAGEAISCRD